MCRLKRLEFPSSIYMGMESRILNQLGELSELATRTDERMKNLLDKVDEIEEKLDHHHLENGRIIARIGVLEVSVAELQKSRVTTGKNWGKVLAWIGRVLQVVVAGWLLWRLGVSK
jgi:hypothetical protein